MVVGDQSADQTQLFFLFSVFSVVHLFNRILMQTATRSARAERVLRAQNGALFGRFSNPFLLKQHETIQESQI